MEQAGSDPSVESDLAYAAEVDQGFCRLETGRDNVGDLFGCGLQAEPSP